MKKIYIFTLSILFSLLTSSMFAQFEVKINPIGFLFNSPDLSGEYIINENISAELVIGADYGNLPGSGLIGVEARKSGYRVRAVGKYFFGPDDGADKFYAGLYLGPRRRTISQEDDVFGDFGYRITAFSVGLTGGYKWVADSGLVFELGAGLGRAFGSSIEFNDSTNQTETEGFGVDGFFKAAVGYRF